MSAMASQITSLAIVYSTIKKTSKFRVTGLCAGNSPGTGEFPAQKASNAENVSIWWCHHGYFSRARTASGFASSTPLLGMNSRVTKLKSTWKTTRCCKSTHEIEYCVFVGINGWRICLWFLTIYITPWSAFLKWFLPNHLIQISQTPRGFFISRRSEESMKPNQYFTSIWIKVIQCCTHQCLTNCWNIKPYDIYSFDLRWWHTTAHSMHCVLWSSYPTSIYKADFLTPIHTIR